MPPVPLAVTKLARSPVVPSTAVAVLPTPPNVMPTAPSTLVGADGTLSFTALRGRVPLGTPVNEDTLAVTAQPVPVSRVSVTVVRVRSAALVTLCVVPEVGSVLVNDRPPTPTGAAAI